MVRCHEFVQMINANPPILGEGEMFFRRIKAAVEGLMMVLE